MNRHLNRVKRGQRQEQTIAAKVPLTNQRFAALFPQNEVADLKEMYSIVKRERAELEKKLVHIRGVR